MSDPKEHRLKTWPVFFEAVLEGAKTFEIRENDRAFQTGDHLVLEEYDPVRLPRYTGRVIRAEITFILSGWGLQEGYVCLALDNVRQV